MIRLNNENNRKKKIGGILIFLLVLLLGTGAYFYQKGLELPAFDKSAKAYKSKIKKPEEWAEDQIAFPAYKDVKVIKGSDKMYIALENPSFNDANLQFKIIIDNNEKNAYQSGLVKPGEAITEVPIPNNLTVGEHNIRLEMRGFAPNDSKTQLNGTNVDFKMHVLENTR